MQTRLASMSIYERRTGDGASGAGSDAPQIEMPYLVLGEGSRALAPAQNYVAAAD